MSVEFISKAKQFMVDQISETTVAHAAQRNLNKKDILKVATSGALALFLAACQTLGDRITPTVNPGVTPTPESGPTIAPETKVTSGELSLVTDQAKRNEIISSLPSDRPQVEGGDQNIETFKITAGGTDFNFAMYDLTQDEINNGVIIETTDANGKKTDIVQSVALYSQIVDYSGRASWTRLIGIDVPQTDSSGKTEHGIIWVYDAKGFPKPPNLPVIGTDPSGKPILDASKAPAVDLSRPVLAYVVPPQSQNSISFAPLTSEPSQMVKFNTPKPLDIKVNEPLPNEIQVSPVVFKFTSENTGTPVSAVTTETPTPEIKNFNVCAPKDYENCQFNLPDLSKGTDSDFYRFYMKNLSKPFSPNAKPVPLMDAGALLPDPSTAPHFTKDPSTSPYHWGDMAGVLYWQDAQNIQYKYLLYPIEMPDTSNPGKNVLFYGVDPAYYSLKGIHIASQVDMLNIINFFKNAKVPPIQKDASFFGYNMNDPLITYLWSLDPSTQQALANLANGDTSGMNGKFVMLNDSFTDITLLK